MPGRRYQTIDEYIATFPPNVQGTLKRVRRTIREAAPVATEAISYQIPTLKLGGKSLIYFAGWKNHVSIYPIPSGSPSFEKAISPYLTGKGTLQFPLERPIPYGLVRRIVQQQVRAHRARARTTRAP